MIYLKKKYLKYTLFFTTLLMILFISCSTFAIKPYQKVDFVTSAAEVLEKLEEDPNQYDIIFTDYYMDDGKGTDVSKYVYNNKLEVPVILLSGAEYPHEVLFNRKYFSGYLDIKNNYYDEIFSLASNVLARREQEKPAKHKKWNVGKIFKDIILPFLPLGALGLSLAFSADDLLGLLAAIPLIGGVLPSKAAIEQDAKIQKFINLRGNFDTSLFKGGDLTPEETQKMKEILGSDFFDLWRTFYNKDLRQMVRENPDLIKQLAIESEKCESTLPYEIENRFIGTNPLYVFTMKKIREELEQDLLNGKSPKQAITNMGAKMFEYHKKIKQIEKFLELKRDVRLGNNNAISWDEIENLKYYNKKGMPKLEEGFPQSYSIGFGILPKTDSFSVSYILGNNNYREDLISSNSNRFIRYKGVDLSYNVLEKESDGWNHYVRHPGRVNNIDKLFEVLQEDWDIIRPIIVKARGGNSLTQKDIETLHKTIAEISYLFTNAKPFFRGSASANLALVYGLYHMAGIEVPQVKLGKELDWEAFAKNVWAIVFL